MYTQALEFLEDEHEAWAPFEQLLELPDEMLEGPADPDGPEHGWRVRDLMAHLTAWQELSLFTARELAVGGSSATYDRVDREWDEMGGEAYNAALTEAANALPLDEVRSRFREIPGEMRGTLTVVPEARWLKDPKFQRYFLESTVEHYAEHEPELKAFLARTTKP